MPVNFSSDYSFLAFSKKWLFFRLVKNSLNMLSRCYVSKVGLDQLQTRKSSGWLLLYKRNSPAYRYLRMMLISEIGLKIRPKLRPETFRLTCIEIKIESLKFMSSAVSTFKQSIGWWNYFSNEKFHLIDMIWWCGDDRPFRFGNKIWLHEVSEVTTSIFLQQFFHHG